MTALRRAILFTTLAIASTSTAAVGQSPATDSLVRRVDSLEHRISALQLRVEALEALVLAKPSKSKPLPTSANSRDVANWRQLRRGMKMDEVRALLGDPAGVMAFSTWTSWQYPNGASVEFDSDNEVKGWMEP